MENAVQDQHILIGKMLTEDKLLENMLTFFDISPSSQLINNH